MIQRIVIAAFLVFAFAGFSPANADQPVPALRSPVTDLTGTLSQAEAAALEAKLRAFESRKGAQIAVLIVRTTDPETIEQYARRVLDVWKLGRKGIDDGALLLVAVDDHDVRIETQYGLEGVLSDAIASRIIRETIVPQFKAGNFGAGIASGIDRMLAVIDGEPLPSPQPEWKRKQQSWQDGLPVLFILPIILAGILRAIFGRFLGAAGTGAVMGVIAWFITALVPVAIGAGFLGFLIALVAGSGPGRWMSGGRGGWGGGWGGGGGGWSSGGGGGWSGGGGGGGGGGASGRW